MDLKELDSLVARHVLGCTPQLRTRPQYGITYYHCPCERREHACAEPNDDMLMNYSADMAAAWDLVERIDEDYRLELHRYSKGWLAVLDPHDDKPTVKVLAPTAPLAIVLAALDAVGFPITQEIQA